MPDAGETSSGESNEYFLYLKLIEPSANLPERTSRTGILESQACSFFSEVKFINIYFN
jgi:hypothetical protein